MTRRTYWKQEIDNKPIPLSEVAQLKESLERAETTIAAYRKWFTAHAHWTAPLNASSGYTPDLSYPQIASDQGESTLE